MNDFVKFNKVIGVYWLRNPIESLLVKIKTKPLEGIHLPKFEQYNTDTNTQILEEDSTKEYTFKWQEKVFSRHEVDKYSNVHNCATDTELGYSERLENTPSEGRKIFTYVNEDYYLPLPFEIKKENKINIHALNSCLKTFNRRSVPKSGRVFNDESSSVSHLFRSDDNIPLEIEQWIAMHVVYDNSEYNEESQLLFKQESILISLFYNTVKNYLVLSPDSNDIALNPYSIDGGRSTLQYAVEVDYGAGEDGEELAKLLNKLHKKWEKKQKQLVSFIMPVFGKRKVHISFEVLSAEGFDMDNIYIEFHIKIPDVIQFSGPLQGKTHTTSALETDEFKRWQFGHLIDLEMELPSGVEPPPIKMFLEVISTDWWGRHRTEGYTCLTIVLDPGCYSRNLSCTRPEELDTVEAESRRFFVGGCHLIKDLEVIDTQLQDANYRFVSTGSVLTRWSTVRARAAGAAGGAASGAASGEESGAALLAADVALRRYRRARALLAAAELD